MRQWRGAGFAAYTSSQSQHNSFFATQTASNPNDGSTTLPTLRSTAPLPALHLRHARCLLTHLETDSAVCCLVGVLFVAPMPRPIDQLADEMRPSITPPLPPRSHPKHKEHSQAHRSTNTSNKHSTPLPAPPPHQQRNPIPSFLNAALPSYPAYQNTLPPSPPGPSASSPTTDQPAILPLGTSPSFHRASTVPIVHGSTASSSPINRYRSPLLTSMTDNKRELSVSSTMSSLYLPAVELDCPEDDHSHIPAASIDPAFPTHAHIDQQSTTEQQQQQQQQAATENAEQELALVPYLCRLTGQESVPLHDFAFWTDGMRAMHTELLVSMRGFVRPASLNRPKRSAVVRDLLDSDEDEEAEIFYAGNRLLQRLINHCDETGNVRHMLLVLCYHLKHLVEQQRKYESKEQSRRRRLRRQQQHTEGAVAPASASNTATPASKASASSSSCAPPVFPREGHWLPSLMSNIRLIVQTLLTRMHCEERESFFRHLKRRPDIAKLAASSDAAAAAAAKTDNQHDLLAQPRLIARSQSCNDVSPRVLHSTSALSADDHHISIPTAAAASPHPTVDRGEDLLRMLLSTVMQAVVHTPVTPQTSELHSQLLALLFCLLEAHDQDTCQLHVEGSQCVTPNGGHVDKQLASTSHLTFHEALMTVSCELRKRQTRTVAEDDEDAKGDELQISKLAFRLVHSLLSHYALRSEKEEDGHRDHSTKSHAWQSTQPLQPSTTATDDSSSQHPTARPSLLRLFSRTLPSLSSSLSSSLSTLVSSSVRRSLRFFFPPSTDFLLADQSALLVLWLAYQFGPCYTLASNPFRYAVSQLEDGMDVRGRIVGSGDGSSASGGASGGGVLRFDHLYRSIAQTSGKEWTCVLLFHLLNVNSAFRAFVIRHPQLDSLLLPLLHVLYVHCDLEHNWAYMLVNCLLVLSQDDEFVPAMVRLRVDEVVPWWTEQRVSGVSMMELLLMVLLRLCRMNVAGDKQHNGYSNCVATLSNLFTQPRSKRHSISPTSDGSLLATAQTSTSASPIPPLHPLAAYQLVALFSSTCSWLVDAIHRALTDNCGRYIDSMSLLPVNFDAIDSIAGVCLDAIIHCLLPQHVTQHTAVLYHTCSGEVRGAMLRLQRMLSASGIKIFQHLVDSHDQPILFDLLGELVDFLRQFTATPDRLSATVDDTTVGALTAEVSVYVRRASVGVGGAAGGAHFPFDPLTLRSRFTYEEREHSHQYYWPQFRLYAQRLGVGRQVGEMDEKQQAAQQAAAEEAEEGMVGDDDVRRILEAYEQGLDYEELFDAHSH